MRKAQTARNVADSPIAFPEDDPWDQITCYCNRPYAGRPMVECSSCLTWIHITCTTLKRRDRVPDIWFCYKCQGKSGKDNNNEVKAKVTGSKRRKSGKRIKTADLRRQQQQLEVPEAKKSKVEELASS